MSTEHVSPAQLRKKLGGSRRAHEDLVEAVRVRLALQGLDSLPIYTGGIPKVLAGGRIVLEKNPNQRGVADLIVPHQALCPSCGIPQARVAWCEMKTGSAHRSTVQVRRKTALEALGFLCVLVRRQEDVDFIIEAHRKARRVACPHPRSR